MKLVYIVMKNADFTEGRGPMMVHKIFSTFDEAEKYVMAQEGIYGSEQARSPYGNSNPDRASYNGYDINTFYVQHSAEIVLNVERKKELKAKALSKLTYEERQAIGF